MKAVSLFAGVGGFDLALERNGISVVASVEIDKKAQKVLGNHFPNSKLFDDVCTIEGKDLYELGFEPADGILVGGFPCQDLSVAGKRAGLAGGRSGLFWEIHRLLAETKTKYFILENVPGLLSSNEGRDFGTVIGSLAQLGYGVAWRVLDAQHFGIPQRRRRVFIVGCLGDDGRTPAQILAIAEGRAGYIEKSKKPKQDFAKSIGTSTRAISKIVGTLAARDYKGVGNQYVEENKLVVFEPMSAFEENWKETKVKNALRANASKSSHVVVFDPHRSDGVRIQGDTINTLTSMMGTGGNNMPMVAYPMHGAMIGRNDNAGPKGSGFFDDNEPSYTLTASSQARHGVVTIAENASMVRRLTPVECERLQGFPDNWTDGQTDGHRYKQMGNAVAVPVVEWIIKNLIK
jgi:DNA (cytosine-5)-methyltransferase 1